jgi:peptidoglycan-associated lipoprotein
MKKKIVYSTVLALAVIMASTGCKHQPVKVTPIGEPPSVEVQNPGIQPGYNPPPEPISQQTPGAIAEGTERPLRDYDQDRDKLAANTVHFAFDSAVIRDSEQANIQAVAAALQQDASASLLIEGNCDERGTEEYNRSLGERRALAAREALVGMNISADRIRTLSNGKDKPADAGHDDEAWSKNRNDTFVILHLKSGS